ncbi:hypothetical protein UCDDS831_g00720 [Diplodia seriata]|uniref:Uncharacterized protein n=1 Tax=Diplodia seriata TaxID=420778 RepID=A0A0G2HGM8_9PEZI|nr:hypothetical protein UCDDS831_g00720 [Diplodia seriata]
MGYFWYGSAADFAQDYGHVWSQHCPHWAISLFIDNGRHQFVPCDEDWSDKELLKHLISFYNAARFCGIPFETVGLRSVRRIEIAKLQDGLVVGQRQSILHLGVSGAEGRPTFYFKHPNKLPGDGAFNLVAALKRRKVLAPTSTSSSKKKHGQQRSCLNIIRTYSSSYVSLAVCVPTLTSLAIGVA